MPMLTDISQTNLSRFLVVYLVTLRQLLTIQTMPNKTTDLYLYEKKLFKAIYQKIETEKGSKSKSKSAEILEGILEEDYHCFEAKKRTLLRWHKRFVLELYEECGDPSNNVKNNIADFLGFNDYHEYVNSLKNDTSTAVVPTQKIITNLNQTKKATPVKGIALISVLAIVVLAVGYFLTSLNVFTNNEHSMIWVTDHFEEYSDDTNMLTLGINKMTLFPYNEEAILNYKKIELNCENPIKKVWFYKVNNHELELFNFPGLHPINGKTLKALTPYMRKTYVCNKTE